MIETYTYELNGRSITVTRSNAGRYVVRDGINYTEAQDPTEFGRTYTEGDLIETESDAEDVLNILMGNKS